jgi:predicted AlkP superfamily pyrophosphatase or phosphodiesterase
MVVKMGGGLGQNRGMRHPVVLFSIDGMRPDGLVQADTPCIDALIAGGASTLTARTVMPSVTLPCHTSMHRGVDVPRHGVTTNTFQPLARPVPSIFDIAKSQGLKTGMFVNWAELRDLAEPASLDVMYSLHEAPPESDVIIAKVAAEHIKDQDFDLIFVYFGYTDTSGHAHSWMSGPYIEAISNADRCVALVLDAFAEKGQAPHVLLLSDHGGHERTHGTEMPEDMTIPWIMHGPRVREGHTITREVRIFDAAPTLASLLEIEPAKHWDGQVVSDALKV